MAGEELRLMCIATGQPPPEVTWVKEGKELSRTLDKNKTTLDKATLEETKEGVRASLMVSEAGQYQCTANNNVGDSITARVSVKVRHKPVFADPVQDLEVEAGNGIEISCSVDKGDPPIDFTWTREGLTLPAKIMATSSTISLSSLRSSDAGQLICRANNSFGVASKTFQLAVLEVPRAPIGVSVGSVSARDAHLSWRGPRGSTPPVETFVVSYLEEGGVSQEVVVLPGKAGAKLRGLRPGTRWGDDKS